MRKALIIIPIVGFILVAVPGIVHLVVKKRTVGVGAELRIYLDDYRVESGQPEPPDSGKVKAFVEYLLNNGFTETNEPFPKEWTIASDRYTEVRAVRPGESVHLYKGSYDIADSIYIAVVHKKRPRRPEAILNEMTAQIFWYYEGLERNIEPKNKKANEFFEALHKKFDWSANRMEFLHDAKRTR